MTRRAQSHIAAGMSRESQRYPLQPGTGAVVRPNRCAARTWQVDPFVRGSLGLTMHDFAVRTGNPTPIAAVEFKALSPAAGFNSGEQWTCPDTPQGFCRGWATPGDRAGA